MSVVSLLVFLVLTLIIGTVTMPRSIWVGVKLIGAGIFFLVLAALGGAMFGYAADEIAAIFKFAASNGHDPFGLASSVVIGYSLLAGACIVFVRYIVRSNDS